MAAHTLTSPLGLTDPAPVKATTGTRANHVHASSFGEKKDVINLNTKLYSTLTVTFGGRATFRTRFTGNSDGHAALGIPAGLTNQKV